MCPRPVHRGTVVSAGVTCLDGGTQAGDITVEPGASLYASGAVISGTITADGASDLHLCGSTVIGPLNADELTGNVELGGGSGDAGAGKITCDADKVLGAISITQTAGTVTIFGLSETGGVLFLAGNTDGVSVGDATVHGGITLFENYGSWAIVMAHDSVTGNLTCDYNSPAPQDAGSINTVSGAASGQCAGLAQS